MSLATELFVNDLRATAGMLKMTVSDLSDAELLQRPVPGANHPLWQIGHLCAAESNILHKFAGVPMVLPEGFIDRFKNRETNHIDSPEHFKIGKDDLLKQFDAVRESSIRFAQSLDDAGLKKPTGWEMAPLVGNLLGLLCGHTQMHVGQIQVLRRKLGKPVLF